MLAGRHIWPDRLKVEKSKPVIRLEEKLEMKKSDSGSGSDYGLGSPRSSGSGAFSVLFWAYFPSPSKMSVLICLYIDSRPENSRE